MVGVGVEVWAVTGPFSVRVLVAAATDVAEAKLYSCSEYHMRVDPNRKAYAELAAAAFAFVSIITPSTM